jgi:hypothetical protein
MNSNYSYQIDSTLQDPPINNLELIEEVDEAIIIPKQKRYKPKIKDTTNTKVDTVYGIKNEDAIPFRNFTPIKKETVQSIEVLFEPSQRNIEVAPWQTAILVLCLFILAFVKAFNNSRFKQSVKAIFSYSVAQEITREEKVFFHRANLLLSTAHLLIISLFVYHLYNTIISSSNHLSQFIMITGFFVAMYLVKYIFSKILFFIFDDTSLSAEYIFNVALYNNLLGATLLPVIGFLYYSNLEPNIVITYLAIPLLLINFILRLIRLIIIGKSKGVSYFYIFLYICTLEILPLVVLFRIFVL